MKKPCYKCGAESSYPRSKYPAKGVTCYKCGKKGHYISVGRGKGKNVKVHEVHTQPAAAQYQNCIPKGYTAVYFNADVHSLKTNFQEPEQPILLKLGIITEVPEYNEWVKSTVIVKKEHGSLRLCLDLKDLNKKLSETSGTTRQFMTFYRSARPHTLCHAQCKVWVLTCHTGQRMQHNDNI